LTDEGRADQAAEVRRLFTTNAPDSDVSMGLSQLLTNLALARVSDLKRVESNPNTPRLEVEHAMIVTLKHDGIIRSSSFMTVA
jgi:hypothetical protein